MKRLLILVIGLALLAVPGVALAAAFGFSNCRAVAAAPTVGPTTGILCYEFDDDTDSGQFWVQTVTALICLDPNITTEGAATAQVMVRRCHTGTMSATPANQCLAILDASLDGTTGASGTQNACIRVGPGAYMLDVTTSAAGDDAIISITGE